MSIEDEVAAFEKFKIEAEAKYLRFQSSALPRAILSEDHSPMPHVVEVADPDCRNIPSNIPVSPNRSNETNEDHSA